MTNVVVPLDHTDAQSIRPPLLETLTLARQLGPVAAVMAGAPSGQTLDLLARYGVSTLLYSHGRALTSAQYGELIAHCARSRDAAVVVMPSSFTTKEVAAQVAYRLEAGLLVDLHDLSITDGHLAGTKGAFGSQWHTRCEVTTEFAVATVRANAVTAMPVERPGEINCEEVTLSQQAGSNEEPAVSLELVSREIRPHNDSARPELAEAAVVVAGGRGTFGDFEPVIALADKLGAAVGTTRDCVDEGWLGREAQIGQTGTTIAPRVYIGAGISGAPHHVGGMSASEVIVAINIDDEAPLVQMADFAVIGDMSTILADAVAALGEGE